MTAVVAVILKLKFVMRLEIASDIWTFKLSVSDAGTTNHWAIRDVWYLVSFRVLLAAYLLGPVIISLYTFQGTITSTFAVTKLRPVISDLEDLGKKKRVIPVIPKGSAVEICFKVNVNTVI